MRTSEPRRTPNVRLLLFDEQGNRLRVIEDLSLDYEVDQKIEDSRTDESIVRWELWTPAGLRAAWDRHYEMVVLTEDPGDYSGKSWDRPLKWKQPWGWSYKHPELPEWRCRAVDYTEAVKTFKRAWAEAASKGRLSGIKGRFNDGAVYKREKGARKLRRKGLPGEDRDHN